MMRLTMRYGFPTYVEDGDADRQPKNETLAEHKLHCEAKPDNCPFEKRAAKKAEEEDEVDKMDDVDDCENSWDPSLPFYIPRELEEISYEQLCDWVDKCKSVFKNKEFKANQFKHEMEIRNNNAKDAKHWIAERNDYRDRWLSYALEERKNHEDVLKDEGDDANKLRIREIRNDRFENYLYPTLEELRDFAPKDLLKKTFCDNYWGKPGGNAKKLRIKLVDTLKLICPDAENIVKDVFVTKDGKGMAMQVIAPFTADMYHTESDYHKALVRFAKANGMFIFDYQGKPGDRLISYNLRKTVNSDATLIPSFCGAR